MAGRRRKRGLTCGAHMAVIGGREGGVAQRRKLMREMYSDGAPRVRGPAGPTGHGGDLGGGVGWHGQAGPDGPVHREGFKMEIDFEFQMNLDFDKTLRNFTRGFRMNLDMRMFPKFF
jgi:hypothetical protein